MSLTHFLNKLESIASALQLLNVLSCYVCVFLGEVSSSEQKWFCRRQSETATEKQKQLIRERNDQLDDISIALSVRWRLFWPSEFFKRKPFRENLNSY